MLKKIDFIFLGWFLTLFAAALCLFGRSVSEMLPTTALQFSASKTDISKILPQGWNFFTRNPREPKFYAFTEQNGKWDSVLTGPKARPSLGYGWIRAPRAQLIEIKHILDNAKKSHWSNCDSGTAPTTCLTNEKILEEIANNYPHPTLCGDVGFVSQELIPWAWAKEGIDAPMSSKVLRLKILC